MTNNTLKKAKSYRSIVYTVGSRFQPEFKFRKRLDVVKESLEKIKIWEQRSEFFTDLANSSDYEDSRRWEYKQQARECEYKIVALEEKISFIQNSVR